MPKIVTVENKTLDYYLNLNLVAIVFPNGLDASLNNSVLYLHSSKSVCSDKLTDLINSDEFQEVKFQDFFNYYQTLRSKPNKIFSEYSTLKQMESIFIKILKKSGQDLELHLKIANSNIL